MQRINTRHEQLQRLNQIAIKRPTDEQRNDNKNLRTNEKQLIVLKNQERQSDCHTVNDNNKEYKLSLNFYHIKNINSFV